MNHRFTILPFIASAFILPNIASAAISAPMEVMATVASTCSVETTAIDFGVYEGPEVNTTGTISVNCNAGVPYKVGLDAGLHFDTANRFMADNAGNMLPYRLEYAGAEWGDENVTDTYPANSVAGTGAGAPTTYTVDALIWPDQPAPPGVYTDTVTVTVAF